MKELISLDLSVNWLSGELPMSLSKLNFLSSFNVSFNSLTGRIPTSTQLQSFSESSFFGNKLCGAPLTETNGCERVKAATHTIGEKKEEDGADWGLIISIVVGFVCGFWMIMGPLIVRRSWRIAYFSFVSNLRQALLRFKHGLTDESQRLASWVAENKDCCTWAGIACDNSIGHVHRIHLPGSDGHCDILYDGVTLKGEISQSLLDLKQLKHLDLSCNDFGGIQVPKFIGSFQNLRYLNLSYSNFGGSIPPQLGNLSELHVLCLGRFHYYYLERTSMANMKWLSSLGMLHHLDMSGLDLSKATDWLQVINTLPSLVQLHLSDCKLSNLHMYVPSVNLTSLSVLDLSYNNFNNSVSQWIFSVTSLVSLDLTRCHFRGPIPSFRNLTSLELLLVAGNDFMNSSSIFQELSSSNLITLDIRSCGISSSVLDSLQNLTNLISLRLSDNQLTKRIPKSLGNFCNFREIDLSGNNIGVVTEAHFIKLVSLKDLKGSANKFILKLQVANWIPPFQLRSLLLRNWVLGPQFPSWLQSQKDLQELDISNTGISSPMPESFVRSFSELWDLNMSNNHIRGPLTFSGIAATLEFIDISSNAFRGSLHPLLCSSGMTSTSFLNLENNHLSGDLPECWEKWPRLDILNLGNNSLSGEIPRTLGSLHLTYLNMHGNKISGRLHSSLMNLTYLDVLQLGRNELTGSIPTWIGIKLTRLRILNLGSNRFDGNIPHELCHIIHIHILDLAHNNLSGNIPDASTTLVSFPAPKAIQETLLIALALLDLNYLLLVIHW
ncbi:receptor-like protein EIX2 [Helianthus annuus]|uniref:receptor-like protein EIX2 n=1 Tax=Helianthus annuus TaxID=4232 RepID=UPI001653031D|nr:receptor-like protein EIX2 [Helianthus annuus]